MSKFNIFRLWDRVYLKDAPATNRDRCCDVVGGMGTIVDDLPIPGKWIEDHSDPNLYVSVRMDDGRWYRHVHVDWLELRSPIVFSIAGNAAQDARHI